jgi:hypothetical protein
MADMGEKIWYVVPLDAGWIVRERTAPSGEICATREQAVARAKVLATNARPSRYVIRRADGSIEADHFVPRHESGVIAAVNAADLEESAEEKVG